MLIFTRLLIFILGVSVGSFLNCLVYRTEKEKSLKGRSYCPQCGHVLSFSDLFPVFSFLFLRGKCRYCKKKISFQYPLVEIASGLVFLSLFYYKGSLFEGEIWNFEFFFEFFLSASIFSLLIFIFVYDFKHFLIPDFAVYLLVILAFIYSFYGGNIVNGLFSAVGAFSFFLFIFLITKGRGMGFGDVKLSFFIGLFLGYPGVLAALFTSFLIGAIMGVGLIALKRKTLKSEIPFGPFLIIGVALAFFFARAIADYYNLIYAF